MRVLGVQAMRRPATRAPRARALRGLRLAVIACSTSRRRVVRVRVRAQRVDSSLHQKGRTLRPAGLPMRTGALFPRDHAKLRLGHDHPDTTASTAAALCACGGEILVSRAISRRLRWEQAPMQAA